MLQSKAHFVPHCHFRAANSSVDVQLLSVVDPGRFSSKSLSSSSAARSWNLRRLNASFSFLLTPDPYFRSPFFFDVALRRVTSYNGGAVAFIKPGGALTK